MKSRLPRYNRGFVSEKKQNNQNQKEMVKRYLPYSLIITVFIILNLFSVKIINSICYI